MMAEPALSAPVRDGKPIIFGEVTQPAQRLQSAPLLDRWPEGYERGGFRLDGDDVLIFAPGRPALRLRGGI
jgi:hypothetical protein